MSNWAIVLCYGGILILAGWLLWRFSHVRWYWHVLSIAAAIGIGFMPMREAWNKPSTDLLVGAAMLLLLCWGAGEWAFRWFHVNRHA